MASLVEVRFVTPYLAEPTAPRAALIRLIRLMLVVPPSFGLTLWAANEFLPNLRLWGRGPVAQIAAVAIPLGVLVSVVFSSGQ